MREYAKAIGDWANEMYNDYYTAVLDLLDPDFSNEFKKQMGASLAHNFIQTGNCHFFETYHLTDAHAYCFLNSTTWKYEKEVEQEFKDFMKSERESFAQGF